MDWLVCDGWTKGPPKRSLDGAPSSFCYQKIKSPASQAGLNNCQSVRYLRSKFIIAPVFWDNDCY
jgi:hypothetical protein